MVAIRVVIVDDHPIMRSGLRELFDGTQDIQIVGEASTGKEALRIVQEMDPDVLILDLELPDITGMEVAKHLWENHSPVRFLALSIHDKPSYVHELIEYGASGYLLKEEAPQIIIEAVRGVARGERGWMSRGISAQLVSWMRGNKEGTIKFSPRELEVLRFVVEGKTNQNIAVLLGISDKTVEKYLSTILHKLGVNSRTEAAVYAVRGGVF